MAIGADDAVGDDNNVGGDNGADGGGLRWCYACCSNFF